MITLSNLISGVRERFEAASDVRWSRSDIVSAINEGVNELATHTGFYELWANVPIRAGRVFYDIRSSLPNTAFTITRVWNTASGIWLTPIVEDDIPYAEILRIRSATPRAFWMAGAFWLGLYPTSNADSGFLRVYYNAVPAALVHDQDIIPDLPDEYQSLIEDYALYELYLHDAEINKALLSFKSFREGANQLRNFVQTRTSAPRVGSMGRK